MASYPIIFQFIEKNFMIHGVKSFGEVDKYTQNIFPFIQWAFNKIC